MKAFITGGSGFIGSHIVKKLLDSGNEVTIFDKRAPHKTISSRCNFIEGDLLRLEAVKRAIEGCEIVYHLAANADISMGVQDTALDLNLTTVATYNVLESMRTSSAKKIVFLSGSGVYGDLGETVALETSGPLLPVSLYGASKLAAEGLISAFSAMFGIEALIFRPANVVGGGQTHGVLFDFIRKLERDSRNLEILGDGRQTKSYLHLEDLWTAIDLILRLSDERITLLNVAADDTVEVNWIAQRVIEKLNLPNVRITHTGGKVGWIGDVSQVRLSTEKLKQFGWLPRHSSMDAIDRAIAEMLANA
jgi:UDP-glucose 4-epimerase